MEYIIGVIVLVIVLFLLGMIAKKKAYKEVDRLEQWKIDMMNRPILDEMSKVKQLNMTGQTEVLFERWRSEWDEVVTIDLPDVEEYLFDAEEYIDKYRFKRAKEVQNKIDQKLSKTEGKINKILAELHELVGSDEKNRQEIEELKERYREARKNLLAHRHNFGNSEKQLEQLLNEVVSNFEIYEEKTENGNYLEAREVVLTIRDYLDKITHKMQYIPQLLMECQSALPSQITELREGYREMVENGYPLDHISLLDETESLEKDLQTYLSHIEKAEIDVVQEGIKETKEKIDVLYDLLEQEVQARAYIMKNESQTASMLEMVYDEGEKLKSETAIVQQTYHLKEEELKHSEQIEARISDLSKRYEMLKYNIEQNDTAHSLLSGELEDIKARIESIQSEQSEHKEKLLMLRKDEMVAREKITDIKKRMNEVIRLAAKSNIPGLPEEYKYLLGDAKESIQNVMHQLEQKPLDMQAVGQYLEVAVMTVEKLVLTTNEIIECVKLAERVIQYGNRYKSKHSTVAKGLENAEYEFRSFNYQEALEQAAAAIEEIEPGALKKIESLLNEQEAEKLTL